MPQGRAENVSLYLHGNPVAWIWPDQGKAKSVSEAKGREQVPVNNNKETQSFDTEAESHQTVIKKGDPVTSVTGEEKDVQKELSVDKNRQSNVTDNKISSNNTETEKRDSLAASTASETQSPAIEQSEKQLSTLDEQSSPDIVEKKIPSSDIEDGKTLQGNPSINEDEQKLVAEENIPSAASQMTPSNPSPDEEAPLIKEEKPLISHQVNTEEKASQDIKEKDISSPLSDLFPATVYEKEALSEFGIKDSEISEKASPVNEDKQGIITDKDVLSETEAKEPPSATSTTVLSTHSPGEGESLVKEGGAQSARVLDEQHEIIPDKESILLLQEEKSPIDYQPIGKEETYPQEPAKEITAMETQSPSMEQSGIQLPTLDEHPSPDIVEERIHSSEIEDGKDLQENSSINKDEQKLVAEENVPSVASSMTPSNPSSDEEVSLIEELIEKKKEDQASVVENGQQENAPDEKKSTSPEEEKPLISHQVDTDEKAFQDIKEEGISSHLLEPFPKTVYKKEDLSEFEIKDNEISEKASPVTEDKQGIITDKDVLSEIEAKEPLSSTSKAALSVYSSDEGESLVKEEKREQSSKVIDEQQRIIPVEKGILLLQEEKPPVDYLAIGNVKTGPQKPVREITEKEETSSTWKIWPADPTQSIILAVAFVLIVAKIGGWIARMIGLPRVVGKLIMGLVLGNFYLITGPDYFDFLKTMPFLKMLSYFGTLLLLLTAGLHTDLRAIMRVGVSSVLVCFGGMAVPAGLGIIVSNFLLPDISNGSKVLLSIVLCSTSAGLLFAILNELKIMNTQEGRVIVGATILTEIIVILSFGVVSGIVVEGGVSLFGIAVSFGIAFLFLITAVIIIFKYGEKFGNFLTKKLTEGLNIPIIVILSLLMAFMFGSVGLHTVIGAFIAGLFLRNVKLRNSEDKEHRNVESFIKPFYVLLVPILFVRVGALVDVESFLNPDAILLGLAITCAALIGKLFCGLCPIEKGTKRLVVGFGMAMKLEGTLILAGIGSDAGIFNDTVFSSLIMAIVFTSTVCPFLMKRFLYRKNNICYEDICIVPEKEELGKISVSII